MSAIPSVIPAKGWFTSTFGYRQDPFTKTPKMHAGVDIAAPPNTKVIAPGRGQVRYVGYQSGYGSLLIIDHGFGLETLYAHNSEVFVEPGDHVERGDIIASIGNSGRATGYHLHYEVLVEQVPVNPMYYFQEDTSKAISSK